MAETTPRDELRLALDVPRWAWRCYRRHLPLIAGLSLVPSVQRLLTVRWGEHLPHALALGSEIVVTGTRLVLLLLLWRLAMAGRRPTWANATEFWRAHWPSQLIQAGLLSLAFLTFDVVAERLVGALLPEPARPTYLAVLLFVKNPTVIAFTFVWWIGILRQVLTREEPATAAPRSAPRS
ncbi:hypothetical protein SAMN05421810_103626 [Amycolatopsis arida]|uniref:Uncharacterized protein n=1 Tax=Amycolatopsis arida TaxID=587909 RepID=A0A1I5TRE1_9PSEU|nr:hypothetical protein [Amycolatopsis arida]TDX95996.1 hypothetical protein CLV69_103131 [Amycolatopsis arida]SFP85634.1 hypothetical protein SAMN05421810_103626 [Amycolatopsis arida]